MQLSVVTTLYQSQVFLDEFLRRILSVIDTIGFTDFELIFVNDGSPDQSLEHLLPLKNKYPQIKIIDLSRNFGHHHAI